MNDKYLNNLHYLSSIIAIIFVKQLDSGCYDLIMVNILYIPRVCKGFMIENCTS